MANKLGRLAQGRRNIKGTNTILFLERSDIPKDRLKDVTYGRIVVAYKPNKSEPNRSRLTVCGNLITCLYDISTPTCDLPTIKMLWKSVLSTKGAKYITLDLKDFYIGTPMNRPEYTRLPIKLISQEIIHKYNLTAFEDGGGVYVEIVRGVYGFPRAGKLFLQKRLSKSGYYPVQFTSEFWRHTWCPIMFTLVVDNFGVKFTGDTHAHHPIKALISSTTTSQLIGKKKCL